MPTAAEAEESEVLACVAGVALEVVERLEEGDEKDCADDVMEENRERVDLDGVGEGVNRNAEGDLIRACDERGDGAGDGDPAQRLAAGGGLEARLGQHDEHAGEGEDELGKECEDVR